MRLRALLLLAGGLAAAAAHGQETEAPDAAPEAEPTLAAVHVIVENVRSDAGTVWLALCNVDLTVEGCPYKKSVPATEGIAEGIAEGAEGKIVEATFEDIPPGAYAVAGYHDLNGNDEFDKLLGVPREPYALSGAAGDMLVPKFEDAVLQMKPGENDVIIRLKRLGG